VPYLKRDYPLARSPLRHFTSRSKDQGQPRLHSLLRYSTVSFMAGMYHLKDLLLLVVEESAEELLLQPDQPPRMLLHGKVRVLDGPLLTSDQVGELLRSIATDEQCRELELCGDAHFHYAAGQSGQFSVHAQMQDDRLHVKIKYLSPN
jgi:Tfp pilus assembly ATPase PilU